MSDSVNVGQAFYFDLIIDGIIDNMDSINQSMNQKHLPHYNIIFPKNDQI